MKNKKLQWIISFCLLVLLTTIAIVCGCGQAARQEGKDVDTTERQLAIADEKTAKYGEFPVNVKPEAESVSLVPDLGEIISKDFIQLSKTEKEFLVKNGFVVLPESSKM